MYDMAVGQYLERDDKLLPGRRYRHDDVFVVGQKLEHKGLPHGKLEEYMAKLVAYIRREDDADDLLKAAVIHFYVAYLHPWVDGNGRMARLLHLWYLDRHGWPPVRFLPFSSFIESSRREYYQAFTLCEQNADISGVLDVTPFLAYCVRGIYNKLDDNRREDAFPAYAEALKAGKITEKEASLWAFVLAAYGEREFSTKQLERDFGHAAYATIRGFVLKFTELGLLAGQPYGNRVKYRVNL